MTSEDIHVIEIVEKYPSPMLYTGFKITYSPKDKVFTLVINAGNQDTGEIEPVRLNKFQLPEEYLYDD